MYMPACMAESAFYLKLSQHCLLISKAQYKIYLVFFFFF